mgnify:CR=1 FL=1
MQKWLRYGGINAPTFRLLNLGPRTRMRAALVGVRRMKQILEILAAAHAKAHPPLFSFRSHGMDGSILDIIVPGGGTEEKPGVYLRLVDDSNGVNYSFGGLASFKYLEYPKSKFFEDGIEMRTIMRKDMVEHLQHLLNGLS